jgi:hypothetical protein
VGFESLGYGLSDCAAKRDRDRIAKLSHLLTATPGELPAIGKRHHPGDLPDCQIPKSSVVQPDHPLPARDTMNTSLHRFSWPIQFVRCVTAVLQSARPSGMVQPPGSVHSEHGGRKVPYRITQCSPGGELFLHADETRRQGLGCLQSVPFPVLAGLLSSTQCCLRVGRGRERPLPPIGVSTKGDDEHAPPNLRDAIIRSVHERDPHVVPLAPIARRHAKRSLKAIVVAGPIFAFHAALERGGQFAQDVVVIRPE